MGVKAHVLLEAPTGLLFFAANGYAHRMRFHIISLFPDTMRAYLGDSILGRAQKKKLISLKYYNPRDFTKDKWARVDRRPYGGGPGMVLEAEPFVKAAEKILTKMRVGTKKALPKAALGKLVIPKAAFGKSERTKRVKVIFFATDGKQFTNVMARDWAKKYDDIIFLSGRYEGIDARAAKILKAEKISVGPYVLTGGELPAMLVIDAIARQIPGVLGTFESVEEKRVASPDVYTRPEVLKWKGKKYRVPKILLSGNHAEIEKWKLAKTTSRSEAACLTCRVGLAKTFRQKRKSAL
jgi:tRNA (guanine37-N1)-methyltransferase